MKKIVPVLGLGITLLTAVPAYADYLVPQATTQVNSLQVTKQVSIPDTKPPRFTKNLTINDAHFLPGKDIHFLVDVKNTGNTTLPNVVLKDIFPTSVDFTPSQGSFDPSSRTLTMNLGDLSAGQDKTIQLDGVVRATSSSNAITCDPNLAQATSGNLLSQDTASFCVENQVMAPAKQLPVTGPKETIGVLALSSFMYMAFMVLLSKSFKKEVSV